MNRAVPFPKLEIFPNSDVLVRWSLGREALE